MGKRTNLKKLSRVELLELLVDLSQDYEELADENNRLKQMLAAQRLPRSTKVGSIAQAALQANGYFEAAQRSADDYLREIKHLRDELAHRMEAQAGTAAGAHAVAAEQARRQAQLEIQQAQAQASRIVSNANAQARAILADARARADQTIVDANHRSHELLSRAQRQVDAVPMGRHGSARRSDAPDAERSATAAHQETTARSITTARQEPAVRSGAAAHASPPQDSSPASAQASHARSRTGSGRIAVEGRS